MTDKVDAVLKVYPALLEGYPEIASLVIETVKIDKIAMTPKFWASFIMKEQLPFVMFKIGEENGVTVHKSVPMPRNDAVQLTNAFADTFDMSGTLH